MDRDKGTNGKGSGSGGGETLESHDLPEGGDSDVRAEAEGARGFQLDDWQREFIEYDGDKVLAAGRQTGKSEAQAYDNAHFAATHPNTNCLLISKTERQSEELLIKTLNYLQIYFPKMIGTGQYKPLKSTVWIVHPGHTKKKPKLSRVMCLPTGLAGEGIRTFTIHKLSADEAQLIPDAVYDAVTPMLLTTGGKISLSGTPMGKQGFFWKAYENKLGHFKVFHVNSREVIEKRPISQSWPEWKRKAAFEHLAREEARMSAKHFKQEYLGEFIEDLDQVFEDDVIAACCILKRGPIKEAEEYYLGVDVGRKIDPCTFEIIKKISDTEFVQIDNIVRKDMPIPKTAEEVINLDKRYNFKGIGIDGGGMGAGVVDLLLRDETTKRKTIDLNNSMRMVKYDWKSPKQKALLKEDMYRNLNSMMEKGQIKLLDDDELTTSLKSCQIEYIEGSKEVKIFGNYTHIAEGLIRAAWLAKEKSLNLRIDWM